VEMCLTGTAYGSDVVVAVNEAVVGVEIAVTGNYDVVVAARFFWCKFLAQSCKFLVSPPSS